MSWPDRKLKSLMEEYDKRRALMAADLQRQLKQEYLERRGS